MGLAFTKRSLEIAAESFLALFATSQANDGVITACSWHTSVGNLIVLKKSVEQQCLALGLDWDTALVGDLLDNSPDLCA